MPAFHTWSPPQETGSVCSAQIHSKITMRTVAEWRFARMLAATQPHRFIPFGGKRQRTFPPVIPCLMAAITKRLRLRCPTRTVIISLAGFEFHGDWTRFRIFM